MKNVKYVIAALLSILILSGCVEPQFNPSSKVIIFENGKPYAVPKNSYYGVANKKMMKPHRVVTSMPKKIRENSEGDFRRLVMAAYRGGNIALKQCKLGVSVAWISKSAAKSIYAKDKDPVTSALGKSAAFSTGEAGCASPLSKQEYEHYLNK